MATFNDMIVTNVGKTIYAKVMNGKTITFNRVVFGGGNPASQADAEALTNLVDARIEGAIESIDTATEQGLAVITVSVNNAELDTGIGIKEIGLFCADPDTGASAMYAYAFSPDDIDVIPSNQYGAVVWKMRLQLAITNAAGSTTTQTESLAFTPVVTPAVADQNVYVSEVQAKGRYIVKSGIVTAFYDVSGRLTNMENAEQGLSDLTISLPNTAGDSGMVSGTMSVTADGTQTLVDPVGVISGKNISMKYMGYQNGTFKLLLVAQYAMQ